MKVAQVGNGRSYFVTSFFSYIDYSSFSFVYTFVCGYHMIVNEKFHFNFILFRFTLLQCVTC